MASTSRTYLASDWQVWTYEPVAGKFRLDFSALNGSDVLGAVGDVGGMAVLDMDISYIGLQDGERPNQSVFGIVSPGTATITASFTGWDKALVQELYPGKSLAITLKNQATIDIDVYGRNSVYFLGVIAGSTFTVDPINLVTTFNIEGLDILGMALNQSMEVSRSTTATKSSSLNAALTANSNLFDSHLEIITNGDLTVNYETTTTEIRSLGAWLEDWIQTLLGIPAQYYAYQLGNLKRVVSLNPLEVQPITGATITGDVVTNLTMETDGADVPTSFNLSNSTLSYSFGTSEANILSLPTQYTATLDVNGAGQLSQISDRIRTYVPRLSPTSITVTTATTYQPIVFDNTQAQSGGQYYYPNNWWANGTDVNVYLSFLATGGVTPNYYTKIVGQSHEITPDLWQTTYQLLKGR
jgi:hypothetical protein